MGQKAHPKSLRLGIIHSWDSNWIAFDDDYAKNVKEDYEIRTHLKKRLKSAMVSRIEIDRKASKLIVRIVTGRPGIVVGRGGQGLDLLRQELNKRTRRKDIQLDVLEVGRIDVDAQLVAESIAFQLEKRVAFRRAIKQAMQRTMRSGAKGIKVMVAGRLGGAEIARTEWAKEGRIPLHTFRADIDYGYTRAVTVFGIIGVKVWIFKGEVMPGDRPEANVKARAPRGEGGPRGGGGPADSKGTRGKRRGAPRRSGPVVTKQAVDAPGEKGSGEQGGKQQDKPAPKKKAAPKKKESESKES